MAEYNYNMAIERRNERRSSHKQQMRAYAMGEHSFQSPYPADANNRELAPNTRVLIHGRPATVWAGLPTTDSQLGYISFSYDDDPYTDVLLHGNDIQAYTEVMSAAQQEHLTPNHAPDTTPVTPIDHRTPTEMQHDIENGNTAQYGSTMPEIIENWALGRYPGQTSNVVPDWMIPNVDDPTYNAEYRDLMLRYRDNPEMSTNLERVREAASRNQIISYMNREHNEMHSIWTDPTANTPDHARLENITQESTPHMAYTATGHPVLYNDPGIDHQARTYMNIVRTPQGLSQQLNLDRLPTLHQGHLQLISEGQSNLTTDPNTSVSASNPTPDEPLIPTPAPAS
jgi:hypothetical protein